MSRYRQALGNAPCRAPGGSEVRPAVRGLVLAELVSLLLSVSVLRLSPATRPLDVVTAVVMLLLAVGVGIGRSARKALMAAWLDGASVATWTMYATDAAPPTRGAAAGV